MKTQVQLDKQTLNRWNKMKKFSSLRDKVDGLIEATIRLEQERAREYLGKYRSWSEKEIESFINWRK